MDHSFMQGVEFVNHLLESEDELTLWYPHLVNNIHPSKGKRVLSRQYFYYKYVVISNSYSLLPQTFNLRNHVVRLG